MMFGAASVSLAQDAQQQAGGPPRGGGRMVEALLNGITLTAQQQVKADSIKAKYQALRQTAMQDQSLDQDARRAKGREMMTKQIDELKGVLTDDQKKVFEKNWADAQARMQQGGGQRPPQL